MLTSRFTAWYSGGSGVDLICQSSPAGSRGFGRYICRALKGLYSTSREVMVLAKEPEPPVLLTAWSRTLYNPCYDIL